MCIHTIDLFGVNELTQLEWLFIDSCNIYFCFIDYIKAFHCVDQNCGKFLKRWEYQTTLPAFWEICMQVHMEQQTGSKLGKEYVKADIITLLI